MHDKVVDLCFLNVVFLDKFFLLITSEDVDTMAEFLVHCVTLAKYNTISSSGHLTVFFTEIKEVGSNNQNSINVIVYIT